jgi:hypothetical protein
MTYQHVQVERGKQSHYCFDEQDLKSLLKGYPANASYNIQRFKGRFICCTSHLNISECSRLMLGSVDMT